MAIINFSAPAQPKPSLTAWERWELASLDEAAAVVAEGKSPAIKASPAVPSAPAFSEEELARLREAARQEGHKEGHERGYADGLEAGRAAAATEARERAAGLAQAMTNFDNALAEVEQHVADEILALALEVARQITRQVIAVQPQVILGVIHTALADLPFQHALVYLHPEDAALVRALAGEHLAHAGHRLHEDPLLARGDVIIETGHTQLDARLATRWQRTAMALNQDIPWLMPSEPDQT
jgi:flagellar assembly protein FliH